MARRMSPDEYQELGRSYYKLKQYEKALETFTNGIEACPTASLYDHRAATYDKLEDFNAAVKDGRQMIRLDKKDVKGYLRTASVLEKMQKPDTALGIYKYGMKNVPTSDKNFKLLQQLHDKLTRKLSPATAVDPFTILPVELVEMVLEYLSFRDLVNCTRASKGWRDYLSKLPKLWLHLDLSGARKPVPRSFVNSAFRRSEYRMSRVTVHRFEHMDVLKNLAKAAKDLTEIELLSLPHAMSTTLIDIVQSAENLKKFVVFPEVTLDLVTKTFHSRASLEHLSFKAIQHSHCFAKWIEPLENLQTLELHFLDPVPQKSLRLLQLFSQTPNLRSLSLTGFVSFNVVGQSPHGWPVQHHQLPPLTSLVLRRIRIDVFPLLPITLQRLVVEYDGMFHLGSDMMGLIRAKVPGLTHLKLSGFAGLSGGSLESLLDRYLVEDGGGMGWMRDVKETKPLQSLSIRGVLDVDYADKGLFNGPDTCFGHSPRILTPALESLDIATLPCNDDEIEYLLEHKIALQSIDLSQTSITGASIKMLADKLPTLKSIKADNCMRISGRDAIHYAERKGISVSYQMGEQKGGRKIRYG